MSQKQINSGGWKARRPKTGDYERRAVLSGYDVFNKAAVENSRARLIDRIVNQKDGYPQNEFSSYYYGSQYNHPKYAVTTHATHSPNRRKRTVVSYPSMVGLRWNTNVETSSVEESRTDVNNDHSFTCKCENCRMKYCRAKNPAANTLKPLKDNIMTFDNKGTMTPKLKDGFCAACSSPGIPKMSDVSVSASCTKDMETDSTNNDFGPIPILKKQNTYKCERCGYKNEKNTDIIHQPEKDVECGFKKCDSKPSFLKSIFKRTKEKPDEVEGPRKTLYNEGINDIVASRYPLNPTLIPPPMNLCNDSSRVSVPSRSIPTRFTIPYSHRSQSRYHATCKKSSTRFKVEDNDELKRFIASPEVVRRCYTAKTHRQAKSPNIKLPRRVLTSERDIEAFVDKSSRSNSPKAKKKSWI